MDNQAFRVVEPPAHVPPEDYGYLRSLAVKTSQPTDPQAMAAWGEIAQYVDRQIAMRRAAPQDDLVTSLLNAQVHGRPLTDAEISSLCIQVVGGGLDTVTSVTSFSANFLARNPEHRRFLIDHPELLDNAVEEIARRFGTSNLARVVTRDCEFGGVRLREGDTVLGVFPLAGLDETVNEDPMTVDFARSRPRHLLFGTGPHTCIGNKLAKREIRIFLEEWLARIPDFHIAPDSKTRMRTGLVNSVAELQLAWN